MSISKTSIIIVTIITMQYIIFVIFSVINYKNRKKIEEYTRDDIEKDIIQKLKDRLYPKNELDIICIKSPIFNKKTDLKIPYPIDRITRSMISEKFYELKRDFEKIRKILSNVGNYTFISEMKRIEINIELKEGLEKNINSDLDILVYSWLLSEYYYNLQLSFNRLEEKGFGFLKLTIPFLGEGTIYKLNKRIEVNLDGAKSLKNKVEFILYGDPVFQDEMTPIERKILQEDIGQIAQCCVNKLDLNSIELGKEYYYMSLPSCIIDSVFSIGIRYSSTQKVVERFCNFLELDMYREYGSDFPSKVEQFSVKKFLDFYKEYGIDFITEKVYNNRCRTSPKNGILKSEAVFYFANVLNKYEVNYFQDLHKLIDNKNFENDIKKIRGQGSGISLNYFFMLAGYEHLIKMDRMVSKFVENCLGKKLKADELFLVFSKVIENLNYRYPALTLRELDHEIWKYSKNI